ncbi:DUF2269 family protein [Paenibacillus favisporus]|uniref:DUF2269 family protein n=1 Tax=Paenibacillus favisporus TaxID=221028 RepID=UPI002DB65931|nr:hypothetical protein [Paenibacillus favisporus]MEC0174909.1 DUF2269 family protein [Paenibacillus favisporus]
MKKMTVKQRKWLLTLHLLFSAVMLGTAVIFLFLSITAAVTEDEGVFRACYSIMHMLSEKTVRVSTIATLVTGIMLSVWTPWGLFKYYWIIVKEILTLLLVILGPVGMYFWTLQAVQYVSEPGMQAILSPDFTVNNAQLWTGIILQIVSLAGLFIISVFKPWGARRDKVRLHVKR